MRRKFNTFPGSYYHVMNRGTLGSPLFRSFSDRRRFLLSLFMAQSDIALERTNRILNNVDISKREVFESSLVDAIKTRRFVKLVAFAMMDNHFHILVEEGEEGGVARFMQRLQTAYSKYFCARYDRKGHLFQGPYKIVPVTSNEQLLYLSAYIHRNPRELPGWQGNEKLYPWSSCRDYIDVTDWQGLLEKSIITDQLENGLTYEQILDNSAAKESPWEQNI